MTEKQKFRMNDDFTCLFCNGKMIDIEGYYICKDCEWIEGDSCPPNEVREVLE